MTKLNQQVQINIWLKFCDCINFKQHSSNKRKVSKYYSFFKVYFLKEENDDRNSIGSFKVWKLYDELMEMFWGIYWTIVYECGR